MRRFITVQRAAAPARRPFAAATFSLWTRPTMMVTAMSTATKQTGALFTASFRKYASDEGPGPSMAKGTPYLLDRDVVKQRTMDVVKNFEKVDAAKVTETSHFMHDLGLDSLDVVEVVMALEQEFVLDIPDHDAEKILSVAEAVEYIGCNPMAK